MPNDLPFVLVFIPKETFSAMRELYMANGEGFALIYSITSSLSFAEVEKIRAGTQLN